jgi:hypothetical protein
MLTAARNLSGDVNRPNGQHSARDLYSNLTAEFRRASREDDFMQQTIR